jgi:hypothetical protein
VQNPYLPEEAPTNTLISRGHPAGIDPRLAARRQGGIPLRQPLIAKVTSMPRNPAAAAQCVLLPVDGDRSNPGPSFEKETSSA